MDDKTKPVGPPQKPVQKQVRTSPQASQPLVKKIPAPKKGNSRSLLVTIGVGILVLVVGIGSGWLLSGNTLASLGKKASPETAAPGAKEGQMEAGLEDESTFRDSAEGTLKSGGIEGEGTHYLDRDMGPDKYVYLTSTVIDLSSFEGKKVKVWGETIAGKKAGWLMDVGKIKVIE